MNTLRRVQSAAHSATLAAVFVVVVTIWAEFSAGLKAFFASLTGHHWTTKGVATAVLFLILWWLLSRRASSPSEQEVARSIGILILAALIGAAVIISFFWWHSLA